MRATSSTRHFWSCLPGLVLILSSPGCLATRGWVSEQMAPVEGRVSGLEARVTDVDTRLSQTNARIDAVSMRLDNLRLEDRFVLSLKDGTTFRADSYELTDDLKSQIDGFLTDLPQTDGLIFRVAGHTDDTAGENYNYELGQRRATSVARYLITQRRIDPTRVSAVSYGETYPVAANTTPEGRRQNRRVEILVYKQEINSGPSGPQISGMTGPGR